ncbi:hypothetical protein JCM10213_003584 [Rhodosporidiobolus nylandii]
MTTLATRHQQLSALARTKHLFYACSAAGLVSLVAVCITILPWGVLSAQGAWVAFALLAFGSFCWLTLSIAATGSLQLARRVRSAWWMLLCAAALHAAMTAYLEASLVQDKGGYEADCVANAGDPYVCSNRYFSLTIAIPIAGAILPLCAIPLLSFLFRSFPNLPQNPRYDSLMDDDVPPGWHTPPAHLAPDSSASDSDDDDIGSDFTGDRAAGKGWYEMGKKSAKRHRPSWSEVKKARREKQRSKGGLSSA